MALTVRLCSVVGCGRQHTAKGWCKMHYYRFARNGHLQSLHDGRRLNADGYVRLRRDGKDKKEHVEIAERALGRRLPAGVVVHHANQVKDDNRNGNLVICTVAYHQLIHKRMRAKAACGHAEWLRCWHCGEWGPPESMTDSGGRGHRECGNKYRVERRHAHA